MAPAAVIAVTHGGGPMPLLGDPDHGPLIHSLREKVPEILKLNTTNAPRAIVLVTAHWSEQQPAISSAASHPLYYDYGGFPREAYAFKYDAPGSPEVAQEVFDALTGIGLKPKMDPKRGWDHGVFVPMMLINPSANVPIVQLSVLSSEDPAQLYAMGRALAPLRESGVAILGSGAASFHNLRYYMSGLTTDPAVKARIQQFSQVLTEAVMVEKSDERLKALEKWRSFPASLEAHPMGGGEHFLPLIVCAGAAADGKGNNYVDVLSGLEMHTYYWS